MKTVLSLVCLLALLIVLFPATASAADSFTVDGELAVYSKSGETMIRRLGVREASRADLGSDEYLSFLFNVKYTGSSDLRVNSAYVRVNGGDPLTWAGFVWGKNTTVPFHVYNVNMEKLGPGIYETVFYVNDQPVGKVFFTIKKGWGDTIRFPGKGAFDNYTPTERAPYVSVEMDLSRIGAFTDYAVDFRSEYQGRTTYLCVCNWDTDLSGLRSQYKKVYRDYDGVAGYAGFQVCADGTHVAIMSIWDVYCVDKKGVMTTIRARQVYPEVIGEDSTFAGEGTGVHCSVPCNWEEGHSYRALIQRSSPDGGTSHLALWICDLDTGAWTRLVEYDTGIRDVRMTRAVAFLENWDRAYAGDVRSMELSNVRVCSASTGAWVPVRTAYMERYLGVGSWNFGVDGSCFWAITNGLPDRCSHPKDNTRFTVGTSAGGSPF